MVLKFSSFITCQIWKFHVVIVQWRQGNIPESVVHVQNLCFAYQTHCFFDILIAITVVVAKAPSWGKACSPWTLKDFQDQRFFLLCTLTGGDQRQDNQKSADKKETRVGDFTFNMTVLCNFSCTVTGHEQKLQIKILLDVSIQGEYLMLFFWPNNRTCWVQ